MKNPSVFWIIDDDPIFRLIASKWIHKFGETNVVVQFEDGLAAMETLRKEQDFPNVVLLDINMPIMDGWEFLDEYARFEAEKKKKTSLYLVSSSIDYADIKRSRGNEFVKDYLIKPLNQAKLEQLIHEASRNNPED